MSSKETRIMPVTERKIRLRTRKRIPYLEILKLLLQGEEVFVEVERKMAYHIKKKLNSIAKGANIDTYIEAYPCTLKDAEEEMDGYVFKMVKINIDRGEISLMDKNKLIGEINKLITKCETQLNYLKSQPPDKKITELQKMIKTRIETLKEVIDLIMKI